MKILPTTRWRQRAVFALLVALGVTLWPGAGTRLQVVHPAQAQPAASLLAVRHSDFAHRHAAREAEAQWAAIPLEPPIPIAPRMLPAVEEQADTDLFSALFVPLVYRVAALPEQLMAASSQFAIHLAAMPAKLGNLSNQITDQLGFHLTALPTKMAALPDQIVAMSVAMSHGLAQSSVHAVAWSANAIGHVSDWLDTFSPFYILHPTSATDTVERTSASALQYGTKKLGPWTIPAVLPKWQITLGKLVTYQTASSIDGFIYGVIVSGWVNGIVFGVVNAAGSSITYFWHEQVWDLYSEETRHISLEMLSAMKSTSYRLLATVRGLAFAYVLTGDMISASGYTLFRTALHWIQYYVNDLAWDQLGPKPLYGR